MNQAFRIEHIWAGLNFPGPVAVLLVHIVFRRPAVSHCSAGKKSRMQYHPQWEQA